MERRDGESNPRWSLPLNLFSSLPGSIPGGFQSIPFRGVQAQNKSVEGLQDSPPNRVVTAIGYTNCYTTRTHPCGDECAVSLKRWDHQVLTWSEYERILNLVCIRDTAPLRRIPVFLVGNPGQCVHR